METIVLHWISSEDIARGYTALSYERKVMEYVKRNKLDVCKEYRVVDDVASKAPVLDDLVQFLNDNNAKTFLLLAYKTSLWTAKDSFADRLSKKNFEFKSLHHECFEDPVNHDAPIWRYINLPKLLDILQTQTLFFARTDKLRESDKFEGQYLTRFSKEIGDAISAGHLKPPPIAAGLDWQRQVDVTRMINEFNEQDTIKRMYVNCWHMASHENMAMWKIYADIFGVCIQSTYNRLCDSIVDDTWSHYSSSKKVYIGTVKYIDRRRTAIPNGNLFWPYLHKSIGYSFEQELRCVISNFDNVQESDVLQEHLRVQVDNQQLIENIFLHPAAPSWYYENLVTLCARHGIDRSRVRLSSLA